MLRFLLASTMDKLSSTATRIFHGAVRRHARHLQRRLVALLAAAGDEEHESSSTLLTFFISAIPAPR
jgi:hypothetical protein